MPTTRTRNTQDKVYIPSSTRKSQYLFIKFPLTDEILKTYAHLVDKMSEFPYQRLYQFLADAFYSVSDQLEIESGQFIANDKFARVRYSPERFTVQTEQQILFLYNPRNHYHQNSYIDGKKRVKNISLIFLANGDDVRSTSGKFHRKVTKALVEFSKEINIDRSKVRVCDHQHLTYDLFAKDKGITGTQTHKLRTIKNRYAVDDVNLPAKRDVLTYAVIDLPINRRLRELVNVDKSKEAPYEALYNLIYNNFIESVHRYNLLDGAVIANGLTPIVRNGLTDSVVEEGELVKLSFNPFKPCHQFNYLISPNCLVDSVQCVIVATSEHKTNKGYGKFLNQVQLSLRSFAQKLDYVQNREEIVIRLHQHIGYNL